MSLAIDIFVPSAHGIKSSDFRGIDGSLRRFVEIHRTGAVNYVDHFGYQSKISRKPLLKEEKFVVFLLKTLDFSREIYSKYNFFGNLKIAIFLYDAHDASLTDDDYEEGRRSEEEEIKIEREISFAQLETDVNFIAKSICDELSNHLKHWKCTFFDGDSTLRLSI